MNSRRAGLTVGLLALCVVSSIQTGCSGDSAGPVDGSETPAFGDITFNPSSPDIGLQRSVQLAVHNETTVSLASVLLNVDAAHPASMPSAPCASIGTVLSPSVIPTLPASGQETITVLVDTNGVDFTECSAGAYDADVFATVDATVLATATIRFSLEAPPPTFGDLSFNPSFENIGNGRIVDLMLTNAGSAELGPIIIGNDFPKNVDFPDMICTTMDVTITPSSVASLEPGADTVVDIVIGTSGVDPNDCEPAQYDLDVFAAVDGQVLGGATVRFNWDGG